LAVLNCQALLSPLIIIIIIEAAALKDPKLIANADSKASLNRKP